MPLALLGASSLLAGLAGVPDDRGWGFLVLGGVCAVLLVEVAALNLAVGRYATRPPEPRLTLLDGEAALLLPRDPAPSRIVSRGYLALAIVIGLGAAAAAWARDGVLVVLALAVAAGLAYLAAPGRDLSGGLWFTPTRIVGEHLGVRWELGWHEVSGAVDRQPMPLLFHENRGPVVRRTGPRGRGWDPMRQDGMVAVDVSLLSGGSLLASYVVMTCLADPARRAVLGTPDSLPPPPPRR